MKRMFISRNGCLIFEELIWRFWKHGWKEHFGSNKLYGSWICVKIISDINIRKMSNAVLNNSAPAPASVGGRRRSRRAHSRRHSRKSGGARKSRKQNAGSRKARKHGGSRRKARKHGGSRKNKSRRSRRHH